MSRQEFLDWAASGGSPPTISDIEPIYENDEVAVIYHNANNPNNNGVVMTFGAKKGGKFSLWRVVRQEV